MWEEREQTFICPRNVTFDQYLLLTRNQQRGETIKHFQSAIRSLDESCQLTLKVELLRKKFTANTTLTPEKALEISVRIELRIRSQLAKQSKQPPDSQHKPFNVREEIFSEISNAQYCGSSRAPVTPRGPTRGNNRLSSNNNTSELHNCSNCGKLWDINRRAKCQSMRQTCSRCNSRNHFAKV